VFAVKKNDVVSHLIPHLKTLMPARAKARAYAPTNIALCKYWGKRNTELNLPLTSSLSIALPDKGAKVTLTPCETTDKVVLNGQVLANDTRFVIRLCEFLDLFRSSNQWFLMVEIEMSIPVAAGLASSACGFASLVLALNTLFQWQLNKQQLSILSRLGSGSAARSLWTGFVEWHAGVAADGMDSVAEPLTAGWPGLSVGILTFSNQEKPLSSRIAMQRTVETSILYQSWPAQVQRDLSRLRSAIIAQDFEMLGSTAEANALSMHATMQSSWPPICYHLPQTLAAMQQIWALRAQGLSLYCTQDAGPNFKLLFRAQDEAAVLQYFPELQVERVF
jgi:diphosphomevalonate decarboxylase